MGFFLFKTCTRTDYPVGKVEENIGEFFIFYVSLGDEIDLLVIRVTDERLEKITAAKRRAEDKQHDLFKMITTSGDSAREPIEMAIKQYGSEITYYFAELKKVRTLWLRSKDFKQFLTNVAACQTRASLESKSTMYKYLVSL